MSELPAMPPDQPPDSAAPKPGLSALPGTLTMARAARLLEMALTTPDGMPGDWRTSLWKPPTVERLNALVPEYEVQHRVAKGATGWVYEARHRLLDRRVALKVLAPAVPGAEEETSKLRAAEGRLIARLSHPNVLRVYDSRPLPDGQHLFVFQYAGGGSLRQRLAEGPLPRAGVLALAAGIAAGLAHAHAAGIIHRDLKPENILFNESGLPMIGDFGSAVQPSPEEAAALACGTTGTPHYRAPEQVAGGPLGPEVDLYAFGIILHEMLTGEVPEGTGTVTAPVLDPAVPAEFRPLLTGLLQPDPERRTPDAARLAQQLRRRAASPTRRRWILTSAAAAGLALAAAGGGWHLKEGPPPPLTPPPPTAGLPLSAAEARTAAVGTLTKLRILEQQGDWEAGNALYAPVVDYFTEGPLPQAAALKHRMAFAAGHSSFRTLLLEPMDFPKTVFPLVRITGFYWCVTPRRAGGANLGTVKDDIVFQPSAGNASLWQISSHQHDGPPNLWPCNEGRTMDEAGATAWVDAFYALEATGGVEAQLKCYAPRVRYYGLGWVAPRLVRASLEERHRQRPGFRCERRGPVKVIAGSHLRWRLEVPSLSFPILTAVAGSENVRTRTFLLAPSGSSGWLIIAESTPLSGQAALDSFWEMQEFR